MFQQVTPHRGQAGLLVHVSSFENTDYQTAFNIDKKIHLSFLIMELKVFFNNGIKGLFSIMELKVSLSITKKNGYMGLCSYVQRG